MTEPSAAAVSTCALCGREVETEAQAYCTGGCRAVHETLGDEEEPPEESAEPADETARPPAAERTFLRVDGMQSVTCERFLETIAEQRDGIVGAEASYVTETIRVDHDGQSTATELRDALSTAGYTAYLRDETNADDVTATNSTRRSREMTGIRKRRSDAVLGLRYALGVVFGAFLLVPYVTLAYPAYLASMTDWSVFAVYEGAFELEGAAGTLFFRIYFVLTAVVLLFTGLSVLRGAYASLRTRRPNTELLVATTVLSAFAYSAAAIVLGRNDVYFDLVLVVAAAVAGVALYETAVKQEAMERLTDLTRSQVDEARLYSTDGGTRTVAVDSIEPGDTVLVREGERVPVDGTLVDSACTVEEAIVTGESLPIRKAPGDELVGGSTVIDGAAVLSVGAQRTSSLDRITATVWDMQSSAHGVQQQANRLVSLVVPLLVVLTGTVILWTLLSAGSLAAAARSGLLTLFVVTPWALGLAAPLSVATSIREALDHGIAVFDETIFERLRAVDVVVFDKTGTLTTGEMDVLEATVSEELCTAVGRLEQQASHPAAQAIATAFAPGLSTDSTESANGSSAETAQSDDRTVTAVTQFDTGIEGDVDGTTVLAGTVELFERRGWTVPDEIEQQAASRRGVGKLPVVVGREGQAEGLIVVGDQPRSGWDELVAQLAAQDRRIVVLTGDDSDAVERFEEHPAVDVTFASVPPAGKTAAIDRLQSQGTVAMVGDGTNDATALARADLGISLGSGTALAADAADLAIVDDSLSTVETAFALASAAERRVHQNLGFAFCYNALAVALALTGWFTPVTAMAAVLLTGGLIGGNCLRPVLPADSTPESAEEGVLS